MPSAVNYEPLAGRCRGTGGNILVCGGSGGHADRLYIEEFRVEGNTVLPARDIEAAVYDFLGQNETPLTLKKPAPRWRTCI